MLWLAQLNIENVGCLTYTLVEFHFIPLLKIVRGELSKISLSVVPADSLLSCKPLILYSPILEKTTMHLDFWLFVLSAAAV